MVTLNNPNALYQEITRKTDACLKSSSWSKKTNHSKLQHFEQVLSILEGRKNLRFQRGRKPIHLAYRIGEQTKGAIYLLKYNSQEKCYELEADVSYHKNYKYPKIWAAVQDHSSIELHSLDRLPEYEFFKGKLEILIKLEEQEYNNLIKDLFRESGFKFHRELNV